MSEASFYLWKKKYGKLGMAEIRELRQLRDENARLKRLVADLTLDKHILGEVVRKKLWGQRAVAYKNRLAGQPLTASRTDQNESRGTSTMIETLRPKTSPNTSSRSTIELGVPATSVALALSDLKQSIGAVGTVSTESWELQPLCSSISIQRLNNVVNRSHILHAARLSDDSTPKYYVITLNHSIASQRLTSKVLFATKFHSQRTSLRSAEARL